MATVVLPNTSKTTTDANVFANVKDNDQAIIDQVNGNLDNTNLASNAVTTAKITDANVTSAKLASGAALANLASASVTDAKLASPNNSVYKTLTSCQGYGGSGGISTGTYAIATTLNVGGGASTNFLPTGGSTTNGPPSGQFRYTSGDYTVAGLTTRFRVNMQVEVGSSSPSTVTFTAGLYPLTISGGNWTLGTVVVGSTALSSGLATNTISPFTSGDFAASALLADPGQYVLGVVVGSISPPAGINLAINLQTRNT